MLLTVADFGRSAEAGRLPARLARLCLGMLTILSLPQPDGTIQQACFFEVTRSHSVLACCSLMGIEVTR